MAAGESPAHADGGGREAEHDAGPGRGIRKVFDAVGVALLVLVQITFLYGVVCRYVFVRPVEWSDEVVTVLYLWCMFLASAFAVTLKDNVAFDMIYVALPASGKRLMMLAGSAAMAGLLGYALPAVYAYVAFLTRERTPVLEWPLNIVYSCVVIFFAAAAARELWRCAVMLTPNWRDHL